MQVIIEIEMYNRTSFKVESSSSSHWVHIYKKKFVKK